MVLNIGNKFEHVKTIHLYPVEFGRIQKSVHYFNLPFPIGDMKAMSASLTLSSLLGLHWTGY